MCFDSEHSDGSTTFSSTASPTHTVSKTAAGRKKKSKAPRGAVTPKLPKFEDHKEKADFMINVFKVKLCTRRRRHTWSGCPYAHLGETAKRRDPNTHHAVPCPEMKQGNRCPRGDQCPYSHHDFEYCTVMCNKGSHCDRSLCFFAHRENELRSYAASATAEYPTTIAEEDTHEQPPDIHDSSSSGEINIEQCVEEMKSSASLTSIADSFRSTYDRFQESTLTKDMIQPAESANDYPPSLFLDNNLPKYEMPSPEHRSMKSSQTATRLSSLAPEFCASADICHLLNRQRGSLVHDSQLPSELQTRLLHKSFSAGQTPHLSPTCHFSGISGDFVASSGIQTLPSCPAKFDLIDSKSIQNVSPGEVSMPIPSTNYVAHSLASQNDPFRYAHLPAVTPSLNNDRGLRQAMDSLPTFNQDELLSHSAALHNIASSSNLLGTPSGRDVLCNVELLQLLGMQQLLFNMQGEMQPSALQSSLFNPTCSFQGLGGQGLPRDQLYNLQQPGDISGLMQNDGFFP